MFIKDQSLSQSVNVLRGRGSDFLVTFATMNYGETAPVEFRLVTQQYLIVLWLVLWFCVHCALKSECMYTTAVWTCTWCSWALVIYLLVIMWPSVCVCVRRLPFKSASLEQPPSTRTVRIVLVAVKRFTVNFEKIIQLIIMIRPTALCKGVERQKSLQAQEKAPKSKSTL